MSSTHRPKAASTSVNVTKVSDNVVPTTSGTASTAVGTMAILEKVRVKVRASLDQEDDLREVRDWLERWKPTLSLCQRSGGVWDERYEVVLPRSALDDISSVLIKDISAE